MKIIALQNCREQLTVLMFPVLTTAYNTLHNFQTQNIQSNIFAIVELKRFQK